MTKARKVINEEIMDRLWNLPDVEERKRAIIHMAKFFTDDPISPFLIWASSDDAKDSVVTIGDDVQIDFKMSSLRTICIDIQIPESPFTHLKEWTPPVDDFAQAISRFILDNFDVKEKGISLPFCAECEEPAIIEYHYRVNSPFTKYPMYLRHSEPVDCACDEREREEKLIVAQEAVKHAQE